MTLNIAFSRQTNIVCFAGVLEEMVGSDCRGLQHHLHSPSAEQKVAVEPDTNHAPGNSTLGKSIGRNVYLRSNLSKNVNSQKLSNSYGNIRYNAVPNQRVICKI